jgi:hypothetical protein
MTPTARRAKEREREVMLARRVRVVRTGRASALRDFAAPFAAFGERQARADGPDAPRSGLEVAVRVEEGLRVDGAVTVVVILFGQGILRPPSDAPASKRRADAREVGRAPPCPRSTDDSYPRSRADLFQTEQHPSRAVPVHTRFPREQRARASADAGALRWLRSSRARPAAAAGRAAAAAASLGPDYFWAVAAERACCCCWSICAMARERSIANCFTSLFDDVASLLSRAVILPMSFAWKSASK